MEKRRKILEAQERLEKTLSCPSLSSGKSIQSIVENQLLRTSFSGTEGEFRYLVEERATEVSNFLEMLRSASRDDKTAPKSHELSKNDWKPKQQTDQLRVMYREGPQGTPFHTLLCEGFVDGPVDCCLCVSWESTLYEKWWPQHVIPTFKIISSSSLQKVRVGEEISLVRVKVPWPLSEREALLHNFELEYFEEDLVIVLLNTIPDMEHIDISTHGFTKDGIPEANDTVRIDVMGGFVLQKVSPDKSYFRAVVTMDMKLDFVPPWLINFIARQLIGNGHKLYTKAVAAVASGEKEYRDALRELMYTRIRERLYSREDEMTRIEETTVGSTRQDTVTGGLLKNEIEEEQAEQNLPSVGFLPTAASSNLSTEQNHSRKYRASASPEVERALGILDEAIAMLHNIQTSHGLAKPSNAGNEASDLMKEAFCLNDKRSLEKAAFGGSMDSIEGAPVIKNDRFTEEILADTSPKNDVRHGLDSKKQHESTRASLSKMQPPVLEQMSKIFDEETVRNSGTHHGSHGNGEPMRRKGSRRKRWRFCSMSCR